MDATTMGRADMRSKAIALEDDLARRIAGGDAHALEQAYDAYSAAVFRHALAILGCAADAEDVLQEVFLKLAKRRGGTIANLRAYLFAAARNEAYSLLRRCRRERVGLEPDAVWSPERAEQMDPAEACALSRALNGLPPEQREVVVLKVYEQLTFEEIGELLHAPMNTVASRYRYALQKMRCALVEANHD